MRKLILSTFFSIVALTMAMAQNEPAAKEILDKAKKKFVAYKSVKIEFKETLKGVNLSESSTGYVVMNEGKLHFKKGDLEVMTDKKKTWSIQHSDKEITRDLYDPEDAAFPTPDKLFENYQNKVRYIKIADLKVNGKLCNVIEIQPTKENKDKFSFFKITVFINKTDYSIEKYVIKEKNGNSFHYEISSVNGNYTPTATEFIVDEKKYEKKGYEIIRLDE